MLKYLAHFLLLSLVWLLMWAFAHDYVVVNTNHNNQQRVEQIEQQALNYRWPMQSPREVVASFRDDWQTTDQGLSAHADTAVGMSLDLQGRWIDPRWQQSLWLNYVTDSATVEEAWLKLEFSDQQQQIYYVSPDLPLSDLSVPIDLTGFLWLAENKPSVEADEFFAWQALPPTNALVLRFFFPKATSVTVKAVEIRQTKAGSTETQPCQSLPEARLTCYLTNQIKAKDRQYHQQGVILSFESFSQQRPWVYFIVAACLLLLWLRWGIGGRGHLQLMAVLGLIFVAVACLHQPWMSTYFSYLRWPLLLVFIWLVFVYRRCFRKPQHAAWLLLASTLLVAAVMLWFGHGGWGFLRNLPFYFVWAWVQQLLLGPLFTELIHQRINRSAWLTAALVGVLFSLIHAPNHMLMMATLLAGVIWSWAWLKYRNLYVNAFSHALLALVFYQTMPAAWLGSARIGIFF